MTTLHVAVDAHNLVTDDRGIGRYARALLTRALRDPSVRFTLVVRRLFPDVAAFSAALDGAPVRIRRSVPADADVVWFPWNGTFLKSRAPAVATIHDAAPFAFPARDARVRKREQEPFARSAASARRILVQSNFTAGEVERRLGVDPAKITVTPLAADAAFRPGPRGEPPAALRGRPYVLHVGAHDERKNTATLCAAYERAFPDAAIALAFTRPPPRLPRGGVVVEARDDAALANLYRGALLVAVPSAYEGFGFPLLEALACAAPALAAKAGALPEVGGSAAMWVAVPGDVEAWAAALRRLATGGAERERLGRGGPAQAARFSWERCTAQTLAVLREAAAGGRAAR